MQIAKLEPQARANILLLAKAYCDARQISTVTLGRYATGTPSFFTDLEARHKRYQRTGDDRAESDRKGSFTIRVYDRLMAWFAENWPAGVEFPALTDLTHNRESESHGETEGRRGRQERTEGAEAPREGTDVGQAGSAVDRLRRLRGTVG